VADYPVHPLDMLLAGFQGLKLASDIVCNYPKPSSQAAGSFAGGTFDKRANEVEYRKA
jgi:hypothetical protein